MIKMLSKITIIEKTYARKDFFSGGAVRLGKVANAKFPRIKSGVIKLIVEPVSVRHQPDTS